MANSLTAKQREALIAAHEKGLGPWYAGSTTISVLKKRGLIERVYAEGSRNFVYRATEAGERIVKEQT